MRKNILINFHLTTFNANEMAYIKRLALIANPLHSDWLR